ncbi:MAG TPA: YetF domain-containing protein [Actinomycetota bacterium]
MFDLGTPWWQIVLRSLMVYAAVFAGLRLMGKRQLGQMTVFDLVVILLIANAVQNAMVGPDSSLQGGILAAAILLAVNFVVARIRLLTPRFERLLEGTPTMLIRDGRYLPANLRKEGIDREEIESALREHGLSAAEDARVAYLEPDGSISIIPMTEHVLRSRKRVRQLKKH